MGLIALKTGNTFGMLCRYAFGKYGSQVISLMIVVTLIGWFSVDTYMIGQASNALFPALGGVFIADYLVKYRKGYPSLEGNEIPAVNWGAFIAWGLGIATNYVGFGITQVNCIIVAAAIEAVFAVISAKRANAKKAAAVEIQHA